MNTPASTPGALRQFADLPGPRGVPVFGNLLQIDSTRVHQQLEAWCAEYGPIFSAIPARLGIGRDGPGLLGGY